MSGRYPLVAGKAGGVTHVVGRVVQGMRLDMPGERDDPQAQKQREYGRKARGRCGCKCACRHHLYLLAALPDGG